MRLALILFVLLQGCRALPEQGDTLCAAGVTAPSIRSLSSALTGDGGVRASLLIAAQVPCLRGTARATVTTSEGLLSAGGDAGQSVSVALADIDGNDGGTVSGFADLETHSPAPVFVTAEIGEGLATACFTPLQDGGLSGCAIDAGP